MSATDSSASSTSTMVSATGRGSGIGAAQSSQGISLVALLTAISSSLVIFGVQMLAFILLKDRLTRIFIPKTYLVPERERTEAPPRTPWGWITAIFRFTDREVIKKCGLDAYFFLRYLRTLLIIFIPMACVILPILVPLNALGGKGPRYETEFDPAEHPEGRSSATANVSGLDLLAWINIRPGNTGRYWAHLVLATLIVVWVCGVCFVELRVYIKIRQDYLTSAEHRLRASATTVLVSAIPRKWLTKQALGGLYDVFPGGIRNIWINRNFDELLEKQEQRNEVFIKLEAAETELIVKAKKAQRKQANLDEKYSLAMRKKEKLTLSQQRQLDDAQANRLAQDVADGNAHHVPQTIDDAVHEEDDIEHQQGARQGLVIPMIPGIGRGLAVVGNGLGKGFGAAGKVGTAAIGGFRNVGADIDDQLMTTNGFYNFDQQSISSGRDGQTNRTTEQAMHPMKCLNGEDPHADLRETKRFENPVVENMYNNVDGPNDSRLTTGDSWWKFWKPPPGSFQSPIPLGYQPGEATKDGIQQSKKGKEDKIGVKNGVLGKVKSLFSRKELPQPNYPLAYRPEYKEDEHPAVWEKYLKKKDRPTHRLARFQWTPSWFPGLPFVNEKVDTIYWCRKQLARLNLEIETDQKEPERFPLMNSAFIQFNHQVAAHMACQSITHHIPRHMAPRTVEISPNDVIWDNMSVKWWELWFRKAIVIIIVTGMIILWAFPVAWTSTLSNLAALADTYSWLHWLRSIDKKVLQAVSGVLPALVLSLLLLIVPWLLNVLAKVQGAQTGTEKAGAVQTYYFAFLFVQVFLVVSVSSGAILALGSTSATVTTIPQTLASQLPKAVNYFFSYMILQALSTSSGTILQLMTLIMWFILPALFDRTAREKWRRNTTLPSVAWGTYFPVYTNFACIGLIYSPVAPIITIFAIITFSLLWVANRYTMLYVSRFRLDTGGLLYPRAINQTFTGLYVMELCLIGLFSITHDSNGDGLIPQAIVMLVVLILTGLYQILLNKAFSPLFRHLPITLEDEAVLRDQAFQRAQERRQGYDHAPDEAVGLINNNDTPMAQKTLPINNNNSKTKVHFVRDFGSWAARTGATVRNKTLNREQSRRRRHRDIEANIKMSNALYGKFHDEIEDLEPEERDMLVKHAFRHAALRARKPVIWIPKDDTGVSEDEIRRTRAYAGDNIWIDNKGAALNSKGKVLYGKSPPDFTQVDMITL